MQTKYKDEILPVLMQEFSYANVMQAPRLTKVTLNIGLGEAVSNGKALETASDDIATITGQHPVITRAKTSISNFKLREGMPIGVMVTLRGDRMWEFTDRLISVVLPRIRDFRGVKAKLDGRGNYTLGLSEQSVFPEVDFDKLEYVQGMDVTFVTSAASDEQGFFLLKELGIPFKTEQD